MQALENERGFLGHGLRRWRYRIHFDGLRKRGMRGEDKENENYSVHMRKLPVDFPKCYRYK